MQDGIRERRKNQKRRKVNKARKRGKISQFRADEQSFELGESCVYPPAMRTRRKERKTKGESQSREQSWCEGQRAESCPHPNSFCCSFEAGAGRRGGIGPNQTRGGEGGESERGRRETYGDPREIREQNLKASLRVEARGFRETSPFDVALPVIDYF